MNKKITRMLSSIIALALIFNCFCGMALADNSPKGTRRAVNCECSIRAGASINLCGLSRGADEEKPTRVQKCVMGAAIESSDCALDKSRVRYERLTEGTMKIYIVYSICNPMHAPPLLR